MKLQKTAEDRVVEQVVDNIEYGISPRYAVRLVARQYALAESQVMQAYVDWRWPRDGS